MREFDPPLDDDRNVIHDSLCNETEYMKKWCLECENVFYIREKIAEDIEKQIETIKVHDTLRIARNKGLKYAANIARGNK